MHEVLFGDTLPAVVGQIIQIAADGGKAADFEKALHKVQGIHHFLNEAKVLGAHGSRVLSNTEQHLMTLATDAGCRRVFLREFRRNRLHAA